MNRYDYLIIGGGIAAVAAIHGIREVDPDGSIAMIGSEVHPPYNRPPLSKKLWSGKPLSSIWRGIADTRVETFLGRRAVTLDVEQKFVTDSQGDAYSYGKLLLATGGAPRTLENACEGVIYYRTLSDYHQLRKLCETGDRFVVVGGGFIGSEIAAALALNGKQVTMLFPGRGIGEHVYPPSLVSFLSDYFRDKGVVLLGGQRTSSIERRGSHYLVTTEQGLRLEADGVIAGIGIVPEVGLAKSAGLAVDNGVVVDEQLRSSQPDIYAAGDVANFFSHALKRRMRIEHEDNALTMGAMAGRNMAGHSELYHHLPYFYSDLFELGYEAVGELDNRLEIVEDWREPNQKGVIYYLDDGYVKGVLLWNVWGKVDAARELITGGKSYHRDELTMMIVDT